MVRIEPAWPAADRDRYAAALMAENISTGLHFLPVHTLTWYREHLAPLAARHRAAGEHGAVAAAGSAPTAEQDVADVLAALRRLHAAFTG